MTLRIRSRAVAVSLVAAGVAAVFAAVPHTSAVHAGGATGAVVVALPPTSTDEVDEPPTSTDEVDEPPTSTDGVDIASPLDAANGSATGKRHY